MQQLVGEKSLLSRCVAATRRQPFNRSAANRCSRSSIFVLFTAPSAARGPNLGENGWEFGTFSSARSVPATSAKPTRCWRSLTIIATCCTRSRAHSARCITRLQRRPLRPLLLPARRRHRASCMPICANCARWTQSFYLIAPNGLGAHPVCCTV